MCAQDGFQIQCDRTMNIKITGTLGRISNSKLLRLSDGRCTVYVIRTDTLSHNNDVIQLADSTNIYYTTYSDSTNIFNVYTAKHTQKAEKKQVTRDMIETYMMFISYTLVLSSSFFFEVSADRLTVTVMVSNFLPISA